MEFTFVHAEMDRYAKYYSVYAEYNIFISDDWNERIERLSSAGSGFFVLHNSQIIGGIYPNPQNNFSTIHQVSVQPQFRRQGIAEAMMLKSISSASDISPATTLVVLIGNPAELLYRKIGFAAGPRYSKLSYSL